MSSVQDLRRVLRRHGHRLTGPRQAVYEALASADGHLTADQVAACASGQVNIATVYRALAVLEEVDVVRSVRLGDDGQSRWELAHPDDHAHLVCTSCGDVDHHVGPAVGQLRRHLQDGHGFVASGIEVVVSGTCAACRGVADDVLPASLTSSL